MAPSDNVRRLRYWGRREELSGAAVCGNRGETAAGRAADANNGPKIVSLLATGKSKAAYLHTNWLRGCLGSGRQFNRLSAVSFLRVCLFLTRYQMNSESAFKAIQSKLKTCGV